MAASVGRWLAVVSKTWPFIHPGTVFELEVRWWCYYVRAARQIVAENEKAAASMRESR